MRHPYSRSERRHNRATIMARRRSKILWWLWAGEPGELPSVHARLDPQCNDWWYQCDKHNLCCSCGLCRWPMFTTRVRREDLKRGIPDNIRAWEFEFGVNHEPFTASSTTDRGWTIAS